MADGEFARALLRLALTGHRVEAGALRLEGHRVGPPTSDAAIRALPARIPRLDQSNSAAFFGEEYVLKLFRRLDRGENPELEIGRRLARVGFPHTAPIAGGVAITDGHHEAQTLAVAVRYVSAQSDAWTYMTDQAVVYLERAAVLTTEDATRRFSLPPGGYL